MNLNFDVIHKPYVLQSASGPNGLLAVEKFFFTRDEAEAEKARLIAEALPEWIRDYQCILARWKDGAARKDDPDELDDEYWVAKIESGEFTTAEQAATAALDVYYVIDELPELKEE